MDQVYWRQGTLARTNVPCLFLDRDGVLVAEIGYLHRREDVSLLAGAAQLISAARARGWAVGIVTNQSGVGRGYYDWAAFASVQAEIAKRLSAETEPFDFVAACGTHPNAVHEALRVTDHPWRKPNAGMLQMAARTLSLDMPASVMVGDRVTDLQAGLAAGVGTVVHLRTGHGSHDRCAAEALVRQVGQNRAILQDNLPELIATLAWS